MDLSQKRLRHGLAHLIYMSQVPFSKEKCKDVFWINYFYQYLLYQIEPSIIQFSSHLWKC